MRRSPTREPIARRVADALAGRIPRESGGGATGHPAADFAAYESYLKGRYFWNQRTGDGVEKAITEFEAAIARDPGYAPAYAGLADTYNLLAAMGFAPGTAVYPRARAAALRALELDPDLAAAAAALEEAWAQRAINMGWLVFDPAWDPLRADSRFGRLLGEMGIDPHLPPPASWVAE